MMFKTDYISICIAFYGWQSFLKKLMIIFIEHLPHARCGDVIHLILSTSQWSVYSLFNTLLSNLILLGIWSTDCLDPSHPRLGHWGKPLHPSGNRVPSFWNSTLVTWCWLVDGMGEVTWIHNHIVFQFLYLTRVNGRGRQAYRSLGHSCLD